MDGSNTHSRSHSRTCARTHARTHARPRTHARYLHSVIRITSHRHPLVPPTPPISPSKDPHGPHPLPLSQLFSRLAPSAIHQLPLSLMSLLPLACRLVSGMGDGAERGPPPPEAATPLGEQDGDRDVGAQGHKQDDRDPGRQHPCYVLPPPGPGSRQDHGNANYFRGRSIGNQIFMQIDLWNCVTHIEAPWKSLSVTSVVTNKGRSNQKR